MIRLQPGGIVAAIYRLWRISSWTIHKHESIHHVHPPIISQLFKEHPSQNPSPFRKQVRLQLNKSKSLQKGCLFHTSDIESLEAFSKVVLEEVHSLCFT